MTSFRAYRAHRDDAGMVRAAIESITLDDLTPGDVVIRAEYSGVNYKDALAMTGAGRIMRRFPLVGGIDVAGVVESSSDARFAVGDRVLVTGCGLSEDHDGGFAERVRVPGEWVVPVPRGLDTREAMALGTAGFTAALAVYRLERNGQSPALGPILVTGPTGGVGSFAVDILAARGYEIVAVTGKPDAEGYLRELGAREVLDRAGIEVDPRPLAKARWGGVVDNLGGDVLAWALGATRPNGAVASIGLAASHELHTTVMPFILRGVSLLGINSVFVSRELRVELWGRLATDLRPRALDRIATRELTLDELPGALGEWIDGKVVGRSVVRIGAGD